MYISELLYNFELMYNSELMYISELMYYSELPCNFCVRQFRFLARKIQKVWNLFQMSFCHEFRIWFDIKIDGVGNLFM